MSFFQKKNPVIINHLLPLIITIFFSIYFLNILVEDKKIKFNELALGKDTNTVFANRVSDNKIHCTTPSDLECLIGYNKKFLTMDLAIWIGNSQLHAINQAANSDVVAPELLHRELKNFNKYLITYSLPNVSLLEKYILINNLVTNTKIDTLIIPVVYDDTRENIVRDDVIKLIDHKTELKIKFSKSGNKILNKITESANKDFNTTSLNNLSENFIENLLKQNLSIWEDRADLRSKLFNFFYRSRNLIFNINSSSIRKKIPSKYKDNLQALEDIIKISKSENIDLIIYVAPIRNDIPIPYDINDYKLFKEQVKKISILNEIKFYNLEGIVPNDHWGDGSKTNFSAAKEYDFMHFKGKGHIILSNELSKIISNKNAF